MRLTILNQKKTKESQRHVDAILKALEILDCFEAHSAMNLKQISEMTHLNKSRIMRLCGTLEAKGYLAHDLENNLYRLGSKVLFLGKAYEQRNTLISLSRPVLQELAQATGESASIYVVDGLKRLCLAREEGTYSIRYSITEGQHMALYAGAGSKVLLAFGTEELRGQALKKDPIEKLTPNTIVDTEQFQKELETIRGQGYAFSAGERDPDVGALSAPVYDHEKNVCAALGIAGPINRFLSEYQSKYLQTLLDAAYRLSRELGYDS